MLTFLEFAEAEKQANIFVSSLLEQAKQTDKLVLTEEQRKRMTEILKTFPDILKESPRVIHLGSSKKTYTQSVRSKELSKKAMG